MKKKKLEEKRNLDMSNSRNEEIKRTISNKRKIGFFV